MKKYITKIYKSETEQQIDQADKEHFKLINLGYKVVKTYTFLTSAKFNYQLIED